MDKNKTAQKIDKEAEAEVAEFIRDSADVINALNEKTASLSAQLERVTAELKKAKDDLTKAVSEKEAAAGQSRQVFADGRVDETIDNMVRAKFLKQAEAAAAAAKVTEDPNMLLTFLDKLAERSIRTVAPIGRVVETGSVVNVDSVDRAHAESDKFYDEATASLRSRIGSRV